MRILKKDENIGVIYVLAGAAMWGIFPIVVNKGAAQSLHPVMFAALSTLFAALGSFIYVAAQGKLGDLLIITSTLTYPIGNFTRSYFPSIQYFISYFILQGNTLSCPVYWDFNNVYRNIFFN